MSQTADQTSAPTADTRERTLTILSLSSCVVVAFALRALALWCREVTDYDEAYYYILGQNLFAGKGYVLNGLPHTAFPPLYPIFTGLTGLFTDNVRVANSLVSVLAGGILPLPLYFLAKEVHGKRAAALAAWAAAVWPCLFFFAAANVQYTQMMYFGSEPLYMTLVVAGMLFMWRLGTRGGIANAALAGMFLGLASLVRSEGPVLAVFLFLWLIVDGLVTRRILSLRAVSQTALSVAAMFVVLSPWLIYVHGVTGRWTLGAKLTNNARVRETLWPWIHENNNRDFMHIHYALNSDNSQMEDPYWGVSDWHRRQSAAGSWKEGTLSLVLSPDWRWLGVFKDVFYKGPRPLVPYLAWVFLIVALLLPPWGAVRLRWWGLCVSAFAAMAFLAVSLYVLPRHELPLVAVFAVATGKGLSGAVDLVARGGRALLHLPGPLAMAIGILAAAAVFAFLCRSGIQQNNEGNYPPELDQSQHGQACDYKVADSIRANTPPGSTLMCNRPWIALRARMDWRVSPVAPPSRILAYARNRGIDFAVLLPWELNASEEEVGLLVPYLVGILDVSGKYYVFDFRALRRHGEQDLSPKD